GHRAEEILLAGNGHPALGLLAERGAPGADTTDLQSEREGACCARIGRPDRRPRGRGWIFVPEHRTESREPAGGAPVRPAAERWSELRREAQDLRRERPPRPEARGRQPAGGPARRGLERHG